MEAMAERKRDHSAEWQQRKLAIYNKMSDLRDSLRTALGGKCETCDATDELEFHHPNGRDWEPREQNLMQRMRMYQRDAEAGNLTLLCSTCNGRDGAYRGYWQRKKAKRRSN